MENYKDIDDLFSKLDHNLKKRPPSELVSRVEEFAKQKVRQVEKFTVGQILSIAASFLLIAMLNFSILKPTIRDNVSVDEEMISYQFIPVNSLYNE